jgi:hypothetical protein
MATITGKLEDILGEAEGGSIEVALCGYGSQVPRANGQALISKPSAAETGGTDGTFTQELTGNDEIVPAGTYYTITVKDKNGDIVQVNAYVFLGGGTYDLDVTDPFDPSQPTPPLPPLIINQLQIVVPTTGMIFDGDSGYTAFKTVLPGPVTAPVFQNMVPGNLYTFIIGMDGTGGWAFVWPANVHNAALVNPSPNGTTVQTFVANEDGSLWAIGPGAWLP